MKSVRFANIIACEFVAQGARNKHTLVNVFAGNILVREFPAIFPLAFYLELFPDPERISELKIQIMVGDDTRAEIQVELGAGTDMGLIALPQMPIQFAKASTLKIVASGPRHRKTTLMEKTVSTGPIPE